MRAGHAFDASEAARAQAAQADVLRANGVLPTPVPLPAAPAAPADEPPSAAAAAPATAAVGASASPSPLPEHSDYYLCKMEGRRCDALTAAQRKDAGHPADADGQAEPAPGGEAADTDLQKNSTAPVSEHSDYYMCKTEGKQCDTLSNPSLHPDLNPSLNPDADPDPDPNPNPDPDPEPLTLTRCDTLTAEQRKDAGSLDAKRNPHPHPHPHPRPRPHPHPHPHPRPRPHPHPHPRPRPHPHPPPHPHPHPHPMLPRAPGRAVAQPLGLLHVQALQRAVRRAHARPKKGRGPT